MWEIDLRFALNSTPGWGVGTVEGHEALDELLSILDRHQDLVPAFVSEFGVRSFILLISFFTIYIFFSLFLLQFSFFCLLFSGFSFQFHVSCFWGWFPFSVFLFPFCSFSFSVFVFIPRVL